MTPTALPWALLIASLALGACGHGSAVKQRFSAEAECNDVKVRAIGGSSYVASGCGQQATYACASYNQGFGQHTVCVRESSPQEAYTVAPATRVRAHSSGGAVQRSFDEQRKLHVVKGKFKTTALGAEVLLVGAPEHELTTVFMHVMVRGNQSKLRDCKALRVLVNGEPFDGLGFEVDGKDRWITRLSGRFEFEVFKPLGRRHAEFGVDACGQRLAFGEEQMPNLLKFLEIFSQIAIDVQGSQNAPAGTSAPGVSDDGVQL